MDRNRESTAYISALEARLTANPQSPLFARLASCYLKDGESQKALDLCLKGLTHFPAYTTAHLILGKCYEALGRNIEAMLEYRRVLKALPDNPTVHNALEHVERKEQEAFRAFSEERARRLKEHRETITFEKYVAEEEEEKESTAEFLLRRLQDVKKNVAYAMPVAEPSKEGAAPSVSPSKIVTATLAEIYATQGEYKEAIDAYKKLMSQRPVEAERYAKRIAELEELSRMQAEHQAERQEH